MKKLAIVLGGILAIVVVATGYFVFNSLNSTEESQDTIETSVENSSSTTSVIETTTTTEEELDPIAERINEMTTEEKVGQLFFVRVPESNQLEDIQNYHLGGYVLFGRDVENETWESLTQKISSYQDTSEIPLLIGADEEGGMVTRISHNTNLVETPFVSPQEIYNSSGFEGIAEDTKRKASILNELGINAGLFPVADVSTDPYAFIYDRTVGLDAEGTSEFVETVVTALKESQSGSTLKHFPGYGNNRDSHVEIVTDDRPLEELQANDFLPFTAGIQAGADSVLVSHNIISSVDPNAPASISAEVHQLLREELAFDGVVMTDDMDMAGLADFISQEEAGLSALQAGNDLVMSSSYQTQIPYVLQAIENGDYSQEQLDTSVYRVLKWKQNLGLIE